MGSVGHSPTSPDAIVFLKSGQVEAQVSPAVADGEPAAENFNVLCV